MKTTIFIKLTSTLALIAFALMAFSSCQQAGRNYQRGYSNQSYKGARTVKPYSNSKFSSSRSSGSNCAGGS